METFEMKPIPGYPGYQATTDGRIWSDKSKRFLKIDTKHGYYSVHVFVNGKTKNPTVHRLVALAFLPNPNPDIYTDVDHIQADLSNNRLENLKWSTHQENTAKAQANLIGKAKLRQAVGAYSVKTGKLVYLAKTAAEIARLIGSNNTCVHNCLKNYRGRRTTHGYVVMYMAPVV